MLYHYIKDGLVYGPADETELPTLIRPETLVWTEGMGNWHAAIDVPAISRLFNSSTIIPPPVPLQTRYALEIDCQVTRKDNGLPVVAQIILVIVILIMAAWIFTDFKRRTVGNTVAVDSVQTEQPNPRTDIQNEARVKENLVKSQLRHPNKYLIIDFSSRKNIINDKIVEGDIYNHATDVSYQNISLEIKFMADSETVLDTKTISLDEAINGGEKLHFKKKFHTYPTKAKMIDVVIKDAKGVEE